MTRTRGDVRGGWLAFAYSSAVLPSTFPATHPLWNSVENSVSGAGMHSPRIEEGPGGSELGVGQHTAAVYF